MVREKYYCTLFDCNYLLKGVVMLQTLKRHCPGAQVYVLCMDELSHQLLGKLNLPGVRLLRLADVENEELLKVKPGRSAAEYCWTLSASLCWHILQEFQQVDSITYLDADLMFFSDVSPIWNEIGTSSIAIIEHRFMPRLAHLEAYGRFNVEWVTFVRSENGLACLKKWRDQCIEWCFARLEDGRLGDQKYLDDWPGLYPDDLHIIKAKGAGLAPWNFSDYSYPVHDGKFFVDESPLIFYHFHQFQLLNGGKYDFMSEVYAGNSPLPLKVYGAYVEELEQTLARIREIDPQFSSGLRLAKAVQFRRIAQKYVPIQIKNLIRRLGIQMW